MDLKSITLGERSQTQKATYYVPIMCHSGNSKTIGTKSGSWQRKRTDVKETQHTREPFWSIGNIPCRKCGSD